MGDISVQQLAKVVGFSSEQLLQQLKIAGVEVVGDVVKDEQRQQFLAHLQGISIGTSQQVKAQKPRPKLTLKSKPRKKPLTQGETVIRTRHRRRPVTVAVEEPEAPPESEGLAPPTDDAVPSAIAPEQMGVELPVADSLAATPAELPPEKTETAPAPAPAASAPSRKSGRSRMTKITVLQNKVARKRSSPEGARLGPAAKRGKTHRRKKSQNQKTDALPHESKAGMPFVSREIVLPETMTVAELANAMSVKASQVLKLMMDMGAMVTINHVLDQETAAILVEEIGHTPKLLSQNALEESLASDTELTGEAVTRPPVVTVMGHVDHGKTTLLDYIRNARVAFGESGGITQHIGAYQVSTKKGAITFLDTPGHEAFTAMRARGAECTDIVVLVVAADDGVMPQTIEAIQHARAAKVPMIVAVNKIDKPGADVEKTKTVLAQHDVLPEDWGGDVIFQPVSAKTGEGVDALLESLALLAELAEYKAVSEGPAHGVIIESRLDRGRGPVSTVLVQKGSLRQGDILLAGGEYGRVRLMLDDLGNITQQAGPSVPVEVVGLSGMPKAGDQAVVVGTEKKAREVALFRQGKFREIKLARRQASNLEDVFQNVREGASQNLNLLLKADTHGSMEAIMDALLKLTTNEVKIHIIASGVGGITESDVSLAQASSAIVLGFNVRPDSGARQQIAQNAVPVKYYRIIYELIDEIKSVLSGMLPAEYQENILGLADVREVFHSSKFGSVAGCMIVEGLIRRRSPIRVLRNNTVIFEGELESLRRFKDDVMEVRRGIECGIGIKDYDVMTGDQIESYERVEVLR